MLGWHARWGSRRLRLFRRLVTGLRPDRPGYNNDQNLFAGCLLHRYTEFEAVSTYRLRSSRYHEKLTAAADGRRRQFITTRRLQGLRRTCRSNPTVSHCFAQAPPLAELRTCPRISRGSMPTSHLSRRQIHFDLSSTLAQMIIGPCRNRAMSHAIAVGTGTATLDLSLGVSMSGGEMSSLLVASNCGRILAGVLGGVIASRRHPRGWTGTDTPAAG